jgi:hypothetical protein
MLLPPQQGETVFLFYLCGQFGEGSVAPPVCTLAEIGELSG